MLTRSYRFPAASHTGCRHISGGPPPQKRLKLPPGTGAIDRHNQVFVPGREVGWRWLDRLAAGVGVNLPRRLGGAAGWTLGIHPDMTS
jgi:hypothetical protein